MTNNHRARVLVRYKSANSRVHSVIVCLCVKFVPKNEGTRGEEGFPRFQGQARGINQSSNGEYKDFYLQCDPEKENVGLYGLPNGKWKVDVEVDVENTLKEIPYPTTGINFCKEGLGKKNWMIFVSVHSDAWLLAVASYYARHFEKAARELLFDMINELPIVTEATSKASVNNSVINNNGCNELPPASQSQEKMIPTQGQQDNKCGKCLSDKDRGEIWICCDTCNKWFHGVCVDVTKEQSKLIGDYECPFCRRRRKRKSHVIR